MQGDLLSSNHSVLQPHFYSTNLNLPSEMFCLFTNPTVFLFSAFNIINVCFLLPLCCFILHHGFQRVWRRKESLSHTDCFTYHLTAIELFGLCGTLLNLCATFSYQPSMLSKGLLLVTFTFYGETFLHVLTCVERYLAVVHPLTYLSLRSEKGTRVRNASVGGVWLLCCLGIGLMQIGRLFIVVNICVLASTLPFVSFCSVSVLCTLIRSGPGKGGGDKGTPTKRRAFYTILAILGVLLLRFAGGLIWVGAFLSGEGFNCDLISLYVWFNLPSSLILLMLFLHRSRRLDA